MAATLAHTRGMSEVTEFVAGLPDLISPLETGNYKHALATLCTGSSLTVNFQPPRRPDILEICCSPDSELSSQVEFLGGSSMRANLASGYDFDKQEAFTRLRDLIKLRRPRHIWVSLPCTLESRMQNLTKREPGSPALANFRRRLARSRIRVARLAPILDFIESLGIDWYFEWPVGASGWGEIRELAPRRSSGAYHEAVVRGCAVGLRGPSGNLLAKAWRILTTNAEFAQHMNLPCSRDHDHAIVQGKITATTSYYPRAMCRRIAKLWLRKADWVKDVRELNLVGSMEVDVPSYLIGAVQIGKEKEEPTDQADLDKMDKLLLKIHCNSGHTNNSNLQRLLMQKKAPKWIVERAGLLKCSDCHEQQTEPSKNVIALNPRAQLWQALGADPFEVEVPSRGEVTKAVIWVDVASRLCVCSELFTRKLDDHRNVKWEELRSAFLRDWAQHHGRPQWLMTDPEGSWMTRDFATWLGSCGIGCGVTAGEAHYQLGLVERAIGVIKAMVKKTATKHSDLTGIEMIHLACTMHNDLERIRGFSPLQWAKGKHPDGMDGDADGFDNLPLRMQEADPNSEFHRNLQIRLDAADAFHRAKAEVAISKARNAATRRPRFWRTGDWVFYWRRKERTKGRRGATFLGSWLGPARVIFVEPEFNPKKLGNGEVRTPWIHHLGGPSGTTTSMLSAAAEGRQQPRAVHRPAPEPRELAAQLEGRTAEGRVRRLVCQHPGRRGGRGRPAGKTGSGTTTTTARRRPREQSIFAGIFTSGSAGTGRTDAAGAGNEEP